jgi:hypothetical protein
MPDPPSLHFIFLMRGGGGLAYVGPSFIASHVFSEKKGGRHMPNPIHYISCFY